MLKPLHKFLFILISFSLIGFIFVGCENELYEDSLYKDKMSFKKISFEEFKRNKKAHDKLKTIKEGTRDNTSMSRYEYDEEYDVYFDPDNIMMVTKDNLRYILFHY